MTAVEAEGLVLGYGDLTVIDTSSFTIPARRVTAVIGPNAAGKSTLLNAIAGLIAPVQGDIRVTAASNSNKRVSYVLQTTKVNDALPISVAEVVAMGRFASAGWYHPLSTVDREAIDTAMDRLGIKHIARKHLPQLSGGQRQRVFVAQGLVQDHDLLLLDEPLTGIDLTAAKAIDDVIHDEIAKGCTVVMTTHDLSEARVADHVLLVSGRVIAAGAPSEVLTAENLGRAYGDALMHLGGGDLFVDDPAHKPVPGRHIHREKTIHTETSPTDLHG